MNPSKKVVTLLDLWTRFHTVETLCEVAQKTAKDKNQLIVNAHSAGVARLGDRIQKLEDTLLAGVPIGIKDRRLVEARLASFERLLTPQFPNLFSQEAETAGLRKGKKSLRKASKSSKNVVVYVVVRKKPDGVKISKKTLEADELEALKSLNDQSVTTTA